MVKIKRSNKDVNGTPICLNLLILSPSLKMVIVVYWILSQTNQPTNQPKATVVIVTKLRLTCP